MNKEVKLEVDAPLEVVTLGLRQMRQKVDQEEDTLVRERGGRPGVHGRAYATGADARQGWTRPRAVRQGGHVVPWRRSWAC